MGLPQTPPSAFVTRRSALLARLHGPALLASGLPRARNFPANPYRFRASSHFRYFLPASIPGAALLFADGATTLFAEPHEPDDALWHGPRPSFGELREIHGLDAVRSIHELEGALREAGGASTTATITLPDAASATWLASHLGRPLPGGAASPLDVDAKDAALADAMIDLRLHHDAAAIAQLRASAEASAGAHIAGMRATRGARHEWEICAAMTGELRRHQLDDAYLPIVTVHGEVLHNEAHDNALAPGDLLLADVGGETPEGWAADITRVWPVTGTFSAPQRDLYDVVLTAQKKAIAMVRPGTRYRAIHEAAGRAIVEGLCALGIFRGDVDGLCERGAAAIFFPHGVGHLLGLDVHDMEDLGDRAGYAEGRTRSTRFGDKYLRLDRDLAPGMAVTIEPGFYMIPAILADDAITGAVGRDLDRSVLARFEGVRGIRIEDDVLCTDGAPEVLSRGVPKEAGAIESVLAEAS